MSRSLKSILEAADRTRGTPGYEKVVKEYESHPLIVEAKRAEMSKGAPGEMDSEMREVIGALNTAGFKTFASCAGHGGDRGFISLMDFPLGKKAKKDVRSILKQYNFRRIRFDRRQNSGYWTGANFMQVEFEGVG